MCFDIDATPPIRPASGAAIEHRDLVLTAADGTAFSAFEALTDHPGGTAVVVLPDIRGLFRFYEELALRFAEEGFDAVAIDYFGRTAGLGKRADDWDCWPHVDQTTLEGVRQDTAAAIAHLRATDPNRPIFTVGFCFGGSNSWHQAASGHGLAGAVGFYGHPDRPGFPQEAPGVIERVADIECPILALLGGADAGIPPEDVAPFDTALTAADIPHEIVFYDGAPHSFFDRNQTEFAAASRNAWHRTLGFIATYE
jgi:carboxymethylenebutenolidase